MEAEALGVEVTIPPTLPYYDTLFSAFEQYFSLVGTPYSFSHPVQKDKVV